MMVSASTMMVVKMVMRFDMLVMWMMMMTVMKTTMLTLSYLKPYTPHPRIVNPESDNRESQSHVVSADPPKEPLTKPFLSQAPAASSGDGGEALGQGTRSDYLEVHG